MWKKIILVISIIIVFMVGIAIYNYLEKKEDNLEEIMQNEIAISNGYVTDECVNEWKDYSKTVQEEVKETSQNLSEENRNYTLKEDENVVKVYYINENDEEVLYKVTDCSIKYLSKDDIEALKVGITVQGIENLNKLLEDFES